MIPYVTGYRPDVDGLRAIAVFFVVIFHAFPQAMPAGFIGVDIFFVISGFLISGLIFAGLDRGDFSIASFYAKRIRRIFPALILVMSICLAYGWMILTAGEYRQLGIHVAGGAAFLDNFIFWREAGYFDSAADTKPMLHLWSLGIEEQFYLVWPVILIIVARSRERRLLWLIGLMALSMAYSFWLVGHDRIAAFYSPLARFWELLLGALVAVFTGKNQENSFFWSKLAAPLGGIGLVASLMFMTPDTPFPGYWALLPTSGAALLIGAGTASPVNRHLLASNPLVFLGLISYPLYLWHWPLLVFARVVESQTPEVWLRLSLVAAAVLLAWMTYRFLEIPIRQRMERRYVVPVLCLGMLGLLFAGHSINLHNGLAFRHDQVLQADSRTKVLGTDRERLRHECLLKEPRIEGMDWCWGDGTQAPDYIVIGDSKGEALYYGMARELVPQHHGVDMGPVNLLWGVDHPLVASAMEAVEQHPSLKTVFLVNAMRGMFKLDAETGFIDPKANDLSEAHIETMVSLYTRAISEWARTGRQVVFVKDNPTFPDPNNCVGGGMTSSPIWNHVFFRKENARCNLRYSDHLAGTAAYQRFVSALAQANPQLLVLDPTPWLCNIASDSCSVIQEERFLYSFDDHISDFASSRLAVKLIRPVWGDMGQTMPNP